MDRPAVLLALIALAFGVPVALFILWPLRRAQTLASPLETDDPRVVLEGEKVLALRAIRELDRDRQLGLLAEDDYATLRVRDEARASVILKRLDALGPAPSPPARPPSPPSPAPAPVPWTRQPAVLAGGAIALLGFGVALGALATRYAAPTPPEPMAGAREEGAPASAIPPMGGDAPTAGPGGSPRPIPKEMLEGMLRAAHASLDAGRYQEAIAAYKALLKREPQNVDAITHLGVILALAGHTDGALEALDKALAIDPSYAHALWDKARILADARHDYAGAIATWERFVAVVPPGQDRENALAKIGEAKRRLAEAPSPARPASGQPAAMPAR
jgi:cytochrome c-type biogenesis protein CcmH/NrfG